MFHRRTYLQHSPENIPGARQARTLPLITASLLALLCGCSQLGVYTESSCTEARGEWVVYGVKPVYTCYNHGRYTTIVSSSPCDWQEMKRCDLPSEQEQVAKNEVIGNSDLYSVLTEFE